MADFSDFDEEYSPNGGLEWPRKHRGVLGKSGWPDFDGAAARLHAERSAMPTDSPVDEFAMRAQGDAPLVVDVNGAGGTPMPQVTNFDPFIQSALGYGPSYQSMIGEADKRRQAALDELRGGKPNARAALLAFASGLLAPTKFGHFSESLSQGLGAAAPQVAQYDRALNEHNRALAVMGAQGSDVNFSHQDTGASRGMQGMQLAAELSQLRDQNAWQRWMMTEGARRRAERNAIPSGMGFPPPSSSMPSPGSAASSDMQPQGGLAQAQGAPQQGSGVALPPGFVSRQAENEWPFDLSETQALSGMTKQPLAPYYKLGQPELYDSDVGDALITKDKHTNQIVGISPKAPSPGDMLTYGSSMYGHQQQGNIARLSQLHGVNPAPGAVPMPPMANRFAGPSQPFARDATGAPAARPVPQPSPRRSAAPAAPQQGRAAVSKPVQSSAPQAKSLDAGLPRIDPQAFKAAGLDPKDFERAPLVTPEEVASMKGSPVDLRTLMMDRAKNKPKVIAELQNALEQSSAVKSAIDSAIKLTGKDKMLANNSGVIGGRLGKYGITQEATNLNALLETIKGNAMMEALKALKEASKNGSSGMGALTEREGETLRALVANIDQMQGKGQLLRHLNEIQQHFNRMNEYAQKSYEELYGPRYTIIRSK